MGLSDTSTTAAQAPDAGTGAATGPAESNRMQRSYKTRVAAARMAKRRPLVEHENNGDEERYESKIGNYSKGLPHDDRGEVDLGAYGTLLRALGSGKPEDFERIEIGLGHKLTSPQAGLGFDLQGADSHHLHQRPAPRFDSAEAAGEMTELLWMALARDVSFTDYATDPLVARACEDLSKLSDFRGQKRDGRVTPATIFRGVTPGDLAGPWLSQFLLRDVPFGAATLTQRIRVPLPGIDYLTDYDEWLVHQNGTVVHPDQQFDPTRRYIRNLRDLAEWVHVDMLYQAYLQACQILLGIAPFDLGLPSVSSRTQLGFAEFGPPHIQVLVTEVATRALKAVWFQKWFVHRRLRPEEYGGRVHHRMTGRAHYPLHSDVLDSAAAAEVFSRHGTYLHPQAFPEGCPSHPSYGAGHATVAGACTTVLKAFFTESAPVPFPVVPTHDGTQLVPYEGSEWLTVGDELNKLAANIACGRNGAGVHWRSDYSQSILLGEEVAICMLEEQAVTYNQKFQMSLTKFDGTTILIPEHV